MQNKMSNDHKQLTSLVNMLLSKPKQTKSRKNLSPNIRIPLSGEFNGYYLTRREAQCVFHAMNKLTIQETAHQMALSPRTIEFYLKRIRTKLKCRRKKELITKLNQTNFKERYQQYSKLYH